MFKSGNSNKENIFFAFIAIFGLCDKEHYLVQISMQNEVNELADNFFNRWTKNFSPRLFRSKLEISGRTKANPSRTPRDHQA